MTIGNLQQLAIICLRFQKIHKHNRFILGSSVLIFARIDCFNYCITIQIMKKCDIDKIVIFNTLRFRLTLKIYFSRSRNLEIEFVGCITSQWGERIFNMFFKVSGTRMVKTWEQQGDDFGMTNRK